MKNDNVSDIKLSTWQDSLGEGKLRVTLTVYDTGKGLHGMLTGGEEPHLGGVVLALPRPSLAQSDVLSADIYSIPVPGHKDVEVASAVSKMLAQESNHPVAISAGIHSDNLTNEDIRLIFEHCRQLGQNYLNWRRQNI